MHTRHFVSQRFGKATVCVENATISITQDAAEGKIAVFTFDPQRIMQVTGDPRACPETLMRLAIGQANKLFLLHGEGALFGASFKLALDTAPWIGDLTDTAYGGATTGYHEAIQHCPLEQKQC